MQLTSWLSNRYLARAHEGVINFSSGGQRAIIRARAIAANWRRERYEVVAAETGVPWWIIGIHHSLECNLSFKHHLATGDPLTGPTVNEPVGLPQGFEAGDFPVSWEVAARAALWRKLKPGRTWEPGFDNIVGVLFWFERWNGWGYQLSHPEVPSPYLWDATPAERRGRYVADGEWDWDAQGNQLGAFALMQALDYIKAIPSLEVPDREEHGPYLELGSRGAEVAIFQRMLNTLTPATVKRLVVDGDFGPKTDERRKAVIKNV